MLPMRAFKVSHPCIEAEHSQKFMRELLALDVVRASHTLREFYAVECLCERHAVVAVVGSHGTSLAQHDLLFNAAVGCTPAEALAWLHSCTE